VINTEREEKGQGIQKERRGYRYRYWKRGRDMGNRQRGDRYKEYKERNSDQKRDRYEKTVIGAIGKRKGTRDKDSEGQSQGRQR
jgi:hypothetical protein